MTSPLAPKCFPVLPPLVGVRMATAETGIKYINRNDLLFLIFDKVVDVAGVFTRSCCPSAPVDHCRRILPNGKARALVVNSGNANAFTGIKGREATAITVKAVAEVVGCQEDEIYIASTGVIGEHLDVSCFIHMFSLLAEEAREDNWFNAAKAIMTTDTFPKGARRTFYLGDNKVTINGIAKGSGMVAPDMGTVLSFIVTDASIDSSLLQDILNEAIGSTLNSITVDSDTSTSDTLLLFATGNSMKETHIYRRSDPHYKFFSGAMKDILLDLSLQVVCDGEGAKKLIEVSVTGAKSVSSAKKIAMSIANSPLVKTAVAGEDANWGRVVMAVGKSGEEADRDRLSIFFGPHCCAVQGESFPYSSEKEIRGYMKNNKICIHVDIGLGSGDAKVWTCDLTKEYVAINGTYRS
ncbi:MAG: glutamate N-acetyltransferase / amino-acid N-acetyltransferase [Candidatus Tokpelaia sp. JSC161]|nr:MAG: glutamate N-acetyltransferase / amino-acid N-acetyltransferase [Candidatus Tokpelaia sp. JSC161]